MSGYTPFDAEDDLSTELVRVRDMVASELDAQLGMRGEAILLADVCEVARAVAVRLGREFRIQCAVSQQAGLSDDDLFGLDGAAFYGSVMPGENDQGLPDRYPVFDYGWPSLSA